MATATFQRTKALFRTPKPPKPFTDDTTTVNGGTAFKADSGFRISALEEWHSKIRRQRNPATERKQSNKKDGGARPAAAQEQNGTAHGSRTAATTSQTVESQPAQTSEAVEADTTSPVKEVPSPAPGPSNSRDELPEPKASSDAPASFSTPIQPLEPAKALSPIPPMSDDVQTHIASDVAASSILADVAFIRPATPPGKGKGLITTATDLPSFKAKVPVPMRERLKTASLVAQVQVDAYPAITTKADRKKLFRFSAFLSPVKDQINLFRKQLPPCRHHLVYVTMPGQTVPETCICIEGLTDANDIRTFHKVMSQTRYQSLYHPWRLCYEASEIYKPAGDTETTEKPSTWPWTFSGMLLESESDGVTWMSTVGGLIEIDGRGYLMTTAHSPRQGAVPDEGDYGLAEETSSTQTLVDEDFPDDVHPAYILVQVDQSTRGKYLATGLPPRLPIFEIASDDDITLKKQDIKLKTVDPAGWRQNAVIVPGDAAGMIPARHLYVDGLCENPAGMKAITAAGVSGTCVGRMTHSPSFIVEDGKKPQEVWTMIRDDGSNFVQGDSGAWVATLFETRPALAIGSITACSKGRAHLRLLRDQFEEILKATPSAQTVSLPSPLIMWLVTAKRESRTITSRNLWHIVDALKGSDALAAALARILHGASFEQRHDVVRLLSLNGRDIADVLDGSRSIALILEVPGQLGEQPRSLGPTWQKLASVFWEERQKARAEDRQPLRDIQRRAAHVPSTEAAVDSPETAVDSPETADIQHVRISPTLPAMKEHYQPAPQPDPVAPQQEPKQKGSGIMSRLASIVFHRRAPLTHFNTNGDEEVQGSILSMLLHSIVSSVLGGVIAGVAWQQLYHDEASFGFGAREGAAAGAISGAFTAWLMCLAYLRDMILAGKSSTEILARELRRMRPTSQKVWYHMLSAIGTLGLTFARPLLIARYLSSLLTTSYPPMVLYGSAAVAALPLLGSSTYVKGAMRKSRRSEWVLDTTLSFVLIFVFEVIGAAVFVAMSKRLGADLLSYQAAVATTAVFAAVALFWPLALALPLFPCTWLVFRRTQKVVQAVESSRGPPRVDAEMGLPTPQAVYPRVVPVELAGDGPFTELGSVSQPAIHK